MDLCLCLCVYNNEDGLPYVLKNVDKITPSNVLVLYDTSNDKSLEILQEYATTRPHVRIIINTKRPSNYKTENIAHARNALLNIIKMEYSTIPYFIMMDSNNYSCIGDIDMDVLNQTLASDDWDAVSFDREAGYYDFWALSYYPFIYSFFHFDNYKKVLDTLQEDFNKKLKDYKYNHNGELITVTSAFNGFAIYRTHKFLNCSYSSDIDISMFPRQFLLANQQAVGSKIIKYKKCDCEHRKFHMEAILRNNARIRISTKSLFKKFTEIVDFTHDGPC
jgi:glycosyltransferase involved in cell wall biosynthesis